MEISLNDIVKVRLTCFGEAILAKYRLETFKDMGGSLDSHASPSIGNRCGMGIWKEHETDEEGFRRFQLFELMEIFGPCIGTVSQQIPFERNSIYIDSGV